MNRSRSNRAIFDSLRMLDYYDRDTEGWWQALTTARNILRQRDKDDREPKPSNRE